MINFFPFLNPAPWHVLFFSLELMVFCLMVFNANFSFQKIVILWRFPRDRSFASALYFISHFCFSFLREFENKPQSFSHSYTGDAVWVSVEAEESNTNTEDGAGHGHVCGGT